MSLERSLALYFLTGLVYAGYLTYRLHLDGVPVGRFKVAYRFLEVVAYWPFVMTEARVRKVRKAWWGK